MLPLIGLLAPYVVGYGLGWCVVDFIFKYSETPKWAVVLWKTAAGIVCMVLCVWGFRGVANRQIEKNLEYLSSVDTAVKLMEEYADAYTADSTADRYIFILQANQELERRQEFATLFTHVIDSEEFLKFKNVKKVRPPISDKAWGMASGERVDWVSLKQVIVNEVRAEQIKNKG